MKNPLISTAVLISFSIIATGCGLFESSDDEIQTLRAELVQLREDVLDLETEIELLAVAPPQPEPLVVTTTTMPEAEDVQVTTTTVQLPTLPSIVDTVVDNSEVEAILTASYQWGPSSIAQALQTVLEIEADGWYGNGTRAAHVAALEERGLATDGVPSVPTTPTTTEYLMKFQAKQKLQVKQKLRVKRLLKPQRLLQKLQRQFLRQRQQPLRVSG